MANSERARQGDEAAEDPKARRRELKKRFDEERDEVRRRQRESARESKAEASSSKKTAKGRRSAFSPTRSAGLVSIDDEHALFRVESGLPWTRTIFSFDELVGYELYENESLVSFARRQEDPPQEEAVEADPEAGGSEPADIIDRMAINVILASEGCPSLPIDFLGSGVKRTSFAYLKARASASETVAGLEAVMNRADPNRNDEA